MNPNSANSANNSFEKINLVSILYQVHNPMKPTPPQLHNCLGADRERNLLSLDDFVNLFHPQLRLVIQGINTAVIKSALSLTLRRTLLASLIPRPSTPPAFDRFKVHGNQAVRYLVLQKLSRDQPHPRVVLHALLAKSG